MSIPPLASLAHELRTGRRSLQSLLDQIEERFLHREAKVLAFVDEKGRFDRLRSEAQALSKRFPEASDRPPLFGVPVGIKDIFHVDGCATGGGSRLPPEELAGTQGSAVHRLRQAGALILGKTVSTEFAYFAPGPTRNPHDLGHTPGGSSSGSAAAVAAGLCPLALGTQTIGSVSRPAAFCGVVGFKPTYDRIPRDGVLELARSFDHVGTFTKDLAGAELAAEVLCDGWQSSSQPSPPVLAIPEGPYLERASDEARAHLAQVCQRLRKAGLHVLKLEALGDIEAIEARHGKILAAEAADFHRTWYPRLSRLYHPRTVELIERGLAVSQEDLREAHDARDRFRASLIETMDCCGAHLWLAPAAPGPAPKGLTSTGDPIMNLPWTQAGFPTLALPAGRADSGLPLGIQLIARPGEDENLFVWAPQIQAALR